MSCSYRLHDSVEIDDRVVSLRKSHDGHAQIAVDGDPHGWVRRPPDVNQIADIQTFQTWRQIRAQNPAIVKDTGANHKPRSV